MKVLVLSNCPVVEHQGSGYVIINTAKSLKEMGYNVDLISPTSFNFLSIISPRAHYYRLLFGMAIWVIKNKNILLDYNSIIVYGSESSLTIFVLRHILKVKVPIILHSNGIESHVKFRLNYFKKYINTPKNWYHFNLSFIHKYCYNNVDGIITVSKYDKDYTVQNLKIPEEKVFFNEPCLPDIFFNEEYKNITRNGSYITYCGTWIARKGVKSIEKVVPLILKKYPHYKFRIIGPGKEFNPGNYFPEDVLNRIEVYPLVESKIDMIRLLSESSIFLFPSLCESFGLVVAEAMCCNCAVITGPTGFAADILDQKEALVLKDPSPDNILHALELLIQNPSFSNELAAKGRKRVENLRWELYTRKLETIIAKVQAKKS